MSGLFGVIDTKGSAEGIAKTAYYGVFSLQHRGQESAGIAVNNNGTFMVHKAPGQVADIFDAFRIKRSVRSMPRKRRF